MEGFYWLLTVIFKDGMHSREFGGVTYWWKVWQNTWENSLLSKTRSISTLLVQVTHTWAQYYSSEKNKTKLVKYFFYSVYIVFGHNLQKKVGNIVDGFFFPSVPLINIVDSSLHVDSPFRIISKFPFPRVILISFHAMCNIIGSRYTQLIEEKSIW